MAKASITAVLKAVNIPKSHFDVNRLPESKEAISVETTTKMEFGFGEGDSPDVIGTKIEYHVKVRSKDGDIYAIYNGTFLGEFRVMEKHGFESWAEMPPEVPIPYFSFLHFVAREKANDAFIGAGFRTLILPIPDELTGATRPVFDSETK